MKASGHGVSYQKYIRIYESELRTMCGLAALWGQIETGGDLFGLYTRGNRPVCVLCTGPGANATHEKAHFSQDLEFCRRAQRTLDSRFGIQPIGSLHSHHSLGLNEPSGGDLQQVMSVASKNNLDRWCEIILTHETHNYASDQDSWQPHVGAAMGSLQIRVNSFVYTDPQSGQLVRAAIRVIPTMSPIRQFLLANGDLTPLEIAEHASCFPLDNILYEPFEPTEQPETEGVGGFPPEIIAQLEELPEEVQEKVGLFLKRGRLVVALPMPNEHTVEVTFVYHPPYPIETIHLLHERAEAKDVMKRIKTNSDEIRLVQIHQILTKAIAQDALGDTAQTQTGGIVSRLRRKRCPSSSGEAGLV